MTFQQVLSKYNTLKDAWNAKKLADVKKLLEELKISLTEIAFLPTDETTNEKELLVAREVLEIGAQFSVEDKDVPAFERYMAMLKTYYTDFSSTLDESPKMYELLGLNLLCLLSQNKTAEFHTELELLPPETLEKNPYIDRPVRIEQFMMEGRYNKVIEIQDSVPAPSFRFFMKVLLTTIRNEIASCMEKAYDKISAKECQDMLSLNRNEVNKFVSEKGWHLNNNVIRFQSEDAARHAGHDVEVPARELAEMAITYAKEMEQIV